MYQAGFSITWFLVFVGTWIYCAISYGFLFGFGLGWLPAALLATLCAAMWPFILAVGAIGGVFLVLLLVR